jgi:hypothetical protein
LGGELEVFGDDVELLFCEGEETIAILRLEIALSKSAKVNRRDILKIRYTLTIVWGRQWKFQLRFQSLLLARWHPGLLSKVPMNKEGI